MLLTIEVFHGLIVEQTVSVNATGYLSQALRDQSKFVNVALTVSRSFICRRNLVRQRVRTTLAATRSRMSMRKRKLEHQLTVRNHDDGDHEREGPFKVNAKENKGNEDIDEGGYNVEEK